MDSMQKDMKIAVFSDIHGNFEALKALTDVIRREKADRIFFLGDIFQRGNQEIECLEYLMNSDITCIKGNCELYLDLGVQIDPDMEPLRGYYDNMRHRLTVEQRTFIHALPLSYEVRVNGRSVLLSHFLIRDKNRDYPFYQLSSMETGEFSHAVMSAEIQKYDLVAVGHTHRNFVDHNVVGVAAAGIGVPSFLMIGIGEKVTYRYIKE